MSLKMLIRAFCGSMFLTNVTYAQQLIKTDTSHYLKLRINPADARGASVADVFDEVKYIPLETTSESLFGSISQLEVVDDYFIILDNSTNCILVFTKSGKFYNKIKGSADNIRYPIRNLTINKWTKQLVYTGDRGKSYTYCTFDGHEVKKIKDLAGSKNKFNPSQFFFIDEDKIINYSGYDFQDSIKIGFTPFSRSLVQYARSLRTVYAKGLTYTAGKGKIFSMANNPFTSQGKDTVFFISTARPYSIYTVSPNCIKLSYKFIFPVEATLSDSFVQNPDNMTALQNYFESHNKQIYALENCYQLGNNLFFEAATWGISEENNLIYNVNSGALLAYQHIQPDARSWFLPIYDVKGSSTGTKGVCYSDGKRVYLSISSVAMFAGKEQNQNINIKYNSVLSNYFKNGSRKDNPVIVQLKPKDNL